MFGYIYKITNLINNKIYIGKHKYNKPELDPKYVTSGISINRAISKYGLNNFKQEIIDIAESELELNQKEIYYIKYYNSFLGEGYNLTEGGDGISNPSKEIIEINRQKHLGKKQSEETKKKRNEKLKKVIHSKEWCQKISASNKGQIVGEEQRLLSSLRHKGTKWYNNGIKEFMLFEDDPIILENKLSKGRIKRNK